MLMSFDVKQVCYPGLPAEGVVAVICAQYALYGIVPEAGPARAARRAGPDRSRSPRRAAPTSITCAPWRPRPATCSSSSPARCPGTSIAYWGPEVRIGVPQPALTVNMDADTNVETLSFSYDGLAPHAAHRSTSRSRHRAERSRSRCPTSASCGRRWRPRPAVTLRHAPLPDVGEAQPVFRPP